MKIPDYRIDERWTVEKIRSKLEEVKPLLLGNKEGSFLEATVVMWGATAMILDYVAKEQAADVNKNQHNVFFNKRQLFQLEGSTDTYLLEEALSEARYGVGWRNVWCICPDSTLQMIVEMGFLEDCSDWL